MALNATGAISLAGATAGQSIALELGRTATTSTSLNESAVRTLLGVSTGAISLSNAYGKANASDPGSGNAISSTPIYYDFTNTTESFTGQNTTLTSGPTYVTLNATGADPAIRRTINIVGSKYPYVQIRLFRTNGTSWDGKVFYTTAGHAESSSFYAQMTEPTYGGAFQWITVDMRTLTIGGSDWTNSTITGIRFDLGLLAVDDFQVDAIVLRGTIYPVAGLYQRSKAGYHNEVVTYMDSGTTNVGATNAIATTSVPTNTSYSYTGYFLAPSTGIYRFAIASDDGGYFWLGTSAISGYSTSNTTINDGGLHGAAYKYSVYFSLTAGTYYPLRYVTGNSGGSGAAYLAFEGPGIALTNTGTGYFYYNGDTTGI